MRVIVTRPEQQAAAWVAALREQGLDAQALPLIGIGALADAAPLRSAWRNLAQRSLVVFVSPNAVQYFFAERPPGPDWPAGVLAAAPGPGSVAALREQGVPVALLVQPAADAATFDSESLWVQLAPRDWAGARVLVVRGADGSEADGAGHGREWLAGQLRARGADVEFIAAYRRQAPEPGAAERTLLAQALQQPARHVWLFSSSEAVARLQQIAPAADGAAARALASHPRIAASARALGFGRVDAVAPSADAVIAVLSAAPR